MLAQTNLNAKLHTNLTNKGESNRALLLIFGKLKLLPKSNAVYGFPCSTKSTAEMLFSEKKTGKYLRGRLLCNGHAEIVRCSFVAKVWKQLCSLLCVPFPDCDLIHSWCECQTAFFHKEILPAISMLHAAMVWFRKETEDLFLIESPQNPP